MKDMKLCHIQRDKICHKKPNAYSVCLIVDNKRGKKEEKKRFMTIEDGTDVRDTVSIII